MNSTEKFDLIVELEETTHEFKEDEALKLIEIELKNHSQNYYIKESEFYDVFMVELRPDKFKTAQKLAKTSLKTIYNIIPIESVVLTRPEKIVKEIINMSKDKIKEGETFAVRCKIRGIRYIKSKDEFIHSIIQEIEKLNVRSNEIDPDWVIHVEVVGENTGISILKRR